MPRFWIDFIKWFAAQRGMVQVILLLLGLAASTAFTTHLLIQNYQRNAAEDAQSIKDLSTRLAVKDAVYEANIRRQDSMHKIEVNNERILQKTYIDHVLKDQEEMKRMLREQIAEKKAKR